MFGSLIFIYLTLGMKKTMKRQIGYIPSAKKPILIEKVSEERKDVPKESPIAKVELTEEMRSKKIFEWLSERPLISVNGICEAVKTDTSNFFKAKRLGKPLKQELLLKLEKELKLYGYTGL